MSNQSNESSKVLAHNIRLSINACTTLLTLLKDEQELLKTRQFDELDKLISKKSESLKLLEQCALQRGQWMDMTKDSPSALKTFTEWAQKNNLADDWFKLQDLFKNCQHANEVNGKFMLRNQATHKQLLDILRGNQNTGSLYNGKGNKKSDAYGNTLGEA